MATSGTRNDSSATSGSGPPARVNTRRKRNGSAGVRYLICWMRAETDAVRTHGLDLAHAGDIREPLGQPLPLRLHLDIEAAAEHLPSKLRHGAEEHDIAVVEQRDPVADALNPIEKVGRQQHAHVPVLE